MENFLKKIDFIGKKLQLKPIFITLIDASDWTNALELRRQILSIDEAKT
jgi:hypothetical protein